MPNPFEAAERSVAAGRLDEAIVEYSRLTAGDHAADALMRRAALQRQRGRLVEAIADLDAAASLAPQSAWPRLWLGELSVGAGRHIAGVAAMRDAVAREPHSQEMRINLVLAATYAGYRDLAYWTAVSLPEALPAWWAFARQTAIDQYRESRAAVLSVLRARRDEPDWILRHWHVALALIPIGRLALATKLLDALIEEIPSSYPAHHHRAEVMARVEGPAAALAFLDSIAAVHGGEADYRRLRARLLHNLCRFDEVVALLGDDLVAETGEPERFIVVQAMLALGLTERVRDYCREWMAASPWSVPPAGFVAAAVAEAPATLPAAPAPARPRIVQFWDKADVPGDVAAAMATWRAHHRGAEHVVFDEPGAIDFLASHYGEAAVATYRDCHHIAMRADYFRVAYLAQAGGTWIDADESCLAPIDDLLAAASGAEIIAVRSGDVPGYLHNFYLGARAGSVIMAAAMANIPAGIAEQRRAGLKPDIWQVSGPGMITRIVGHCIADGQVPATSDRVRLLPLQQYRSFARTEHLLAYKTAGAQNWQLA